MQHLQWFPGHMTSAMREMEKSVKLVDGVIVILDARCPKASLNAKLNGIFGNKKVLYVLNKCDLADDNRTKKTVQEFVSEGKEVMSMSANDKRSVSYLYDRIFSLLKDKVEKNKEKGVFKPVRIMVAGIPNTGKSTIINSLFGGKKAVTGNKAGVTRSEQWVRLKELELLDTPGTMPPSFDNQQMAIHLAYVGCMNDANLDLPDLAFEFIKEVSVLYPEQLKARYKLNDLNGETLEIFERICKNRGFIMRGGEYDYVRCATAIIDDFRSGRIGKISFE